MSNVRRSRVIWLLSSTMSAVRLCRPSLCNTGLEIGTPERLRDGSCDMTAIPVPPAIVQGNRKDAVNKAATHAVLRIANHPSAGSVPQFWAYRRIPAAMQAGHDVLSRYMLAESRARVGEG